ncbi:MAG: sigma-70 family RNA polymerase sigma factor [Prevotella sp.]|nr:sigma-70 family RNA polymerase sigma factor [Prevotella sp.]
METHELISRCKAGEREALHLFYEQYRPRLLSICRQYTKGDDVAEDLLHDAFVVIMTSIGQLKDADKLESWMTSIVRNVGFHYREHQNKEQEVLQQIAKESQGQVHDSLTPDYDQLLSLVSQLPQGYQQVFRLSVFEGLSHQEISQMLGIAPHSSSSQLFHAKRMLQTLIKQSWVLILLLIAIPSAIWKLLRKPEPEVKPTAEAPKPQKHQPEPVIETPHDEIVYASVDKRPAHHPIRYQTEAVIQSDSIPNYIIEEKADTLTKVAQAPKGKEPTPDTLIYQQTPLPSLDDTHLIATTKPKKPSWDIRLAYNGQTGRSNTDISPTAIYTYSFASASNSFVPSDYSISNWIDYSWSLNNAIPSDEVTAETRSLKAIAAQNASINHGEMVAQHTHYLPLTIQMTLSRRFTPHLSIETGLSYTQMKSKSITGSPTAHIQEIQRLRYLGIPFKLGWQWYNKKHFSLYSSGGAMLELPIHSTLNVDHFNNGLNTYSQESSLSIPVQWSASFGFGIQYDFTPHFGFYIEPSLQYFFDDGSDLKTYRTEHPLQVTLPLGIRFHW